MERFEWSDAKNLQLKLERGISFEEIEEARQAARNTFNKTKRVNLRLTERDFHKAHIKKAQEEGFPYQTLLSSVIHKYLTGCLIRQCMIKKYLQFEICPPQ